MEMLGSVVPVVPGLVPLVPEPLERAGGWESLERTGGSGLSAATRCSPSACCRRFPAPAWLC